MKIGITERGDAGLDLGWMKKLDKVDGAILISKHPAKLLEALGELSVPELDKIIVHCTITGYGNAPIEPNVPHPAQALMAYKNLLQMFGPERTVLRIDPIIPSDRGTIIASSILHHAGGRVRISFLDAYVHVRFRFRAAGMGAATAWEGLHAPLDQRMKSFCTLQAATTHHIEVCGEPGFLCEGCVSLLDFKALKLNAPLSDVWKKAQRPECACATVEKTELLTRKKQCLSRCLYCYWVDKVGREG